MLLKRQFKRLKNNHVESISDEELKVLAAQLADIRAKEKAQDGFAGER